MNPTPTGTGTVFVRGTVYVPIELEKQERKEIAFPHASVYLVRASDPNTPIASALSDLSGRFSIKADNRGGDLRLCVEAPPEFPRICDEKTLRFTLPNVPYGKLYLMPPQLKKDEARIYGKVSLEDGRPARGFDPALRVNSYPRVEMTTASSGYKGYVNNFREYIVPRVPTKQDFAIRATIDKESLVRKIHHLSKLTPGRAHELDLLLRNSAPRLRLLSATQNGKPVQVAAPGSKIMLNAVADDPNRDKVEVRWLLPDGTIVGPTTDTQLEWNVPARQGNYPIRVMVSDARGGYVEDGIKINASTKGAHFSGSVVDTSGAPVAGALIEVNGRLINANAQGRFNYYVPIADRYVMNIRAAGVEAPGKPSYGTASFIYTAPVSGGLWTLRRGQVETVDPTKVISIQQKRDERDCQVTRARQVDWKQFLEPEAFEWQDGRGNARSIRDLAAKSPATVENVVRLVGRMNEDLGRTFGRSAGLKKDFDFQRLRCRTDGIAVEIPANSLIDPATGRAPAGNVQISVSTIDAASAGQMPGDFTVADGSKLLSMETFGAGSVELGAGPIRYNLKSGATADVSIPVDATQTSGGASLPPKIPFLYYDETAGVWRQDGEATLSGSGSSAYYKKKVTHFSTMNADILKEGESCVAVEVDPAAGFSLPFEAEVVMQPSVVNPNVFQVRTMTIDSLKSNVIYNLPNNKDIVITPYISGTKPDGSTGLVPAGVFVVNTGGSQTSLAKPPTVNSDGTYYAESGGVATGPCASRVTLKILTPVSIAAEYEYLQGLYFEATNLNEFSDLFDEIDGGAIAYYTHADPRGHRLSFKLFKEKNRFGLPLGPNEVEWDAQYANSGDLGFGRDMHCRRNNGGDGNFDYACYVTNFGQPPLNNADQLDADNVLDPNVLPDATVAMEYSRVENPSTELIEFPDDQRAVKFYVYDTKNPDSDRLRNADLDGAGPRPVPQLCMVCHGGQVASLAADPTNPTGPKIGAFADRNDILSMRSNFLPFDLHLFNFPASKGRLAQEPSFKGMNLDIVRGVSVANGVNGAAIVELIDDSLYAGGSATQQDDVAISGWEPATPNSPAHVLYTKVFARACRTCHIALPFAGPAFTTKAEFDAQIGSIQGLVCDKKVMPHAKRTNDIFWTSLGPSMPAFLQLYGQTFPAWSSLPESQCGQFYQGSATVPSVFSTQMHPLLVDQCGLCHSTSGNANFAVGGSVSSVYTSITTQNTLDNATQYIVPNSLATSRIYQRITTGVPPNRMPMNGADLVVTDTDSDGLNDAGEVGSWINAGAVGP